MKNTTKKILTAALLLTGLSLSAQTGAVSGSIKTSDGKAAEFVNVAVMGTSKGATIDKNGTYLIKNLEAGTYTVAAALIGVEKQQQVIEVKPGETSTLDFILKENAKELEEVVVSTGINK